MADTLTPEAAKSKIVTVTLSEPIVRGNDKITGITLRKPKAGELRGLKVEDLFTTDVNALCILLPRITMPPLIAADVEQLEADDLLEVAGTVKGFFMPQAMKDALARVTGNESQAD